MAMVGVASGSLQLGLFGLVWGSAAAWRRSIHHMNGVNSRSGFELR